MINFRLDPPAEGTPEVETEDPPFEHKAKVATFNIARDPNVKVPVKGEVTATVAFRDAPARGLEVRQALRQMLNVVRQNVLPMFS